MHAGFAFLELGTVSNKNQVNALGKIISDFAVSTLAYFFIGYGISYGLHSWRRPASFGSAADGLNNCGAAKNRAALLNIIACDMILTVMNHWAPPP